MFRSSCGGQPGGMAPVLGSSRKPPPRPFDAHLRLPKTPPSQNSVSQRDLQSIEQLKQRSFCSTTVSSRHLDHFSFLVWITFICQKLSLTRFYQSRKKVSFFPTSTGTSHLLGGLSPKTKASKTIPQQRHSPVSARQAFCKKYHLPDLTDTSSLGSRRITFCTLRGVRRCARRSGTKGLWTSECSPRVAGVRRGQDARLQCEVVAPTGSVLTWYKDGVSLNREGAQVEVGSTPQELLEEATNMLGLEEELSSTASTSASVLQISSVVYLDCVSNQHQATYKLEVRAPRSQKSYSRLFTVVIVGDESETLEEGPTCRLGGLVNALPRIYQHSPAAMGHVGDSVTLPCRSQGHNVTREWFLNDERISGDASYQISGTGDLIVRRLSAQGRTRYTAGWPARGSLPSLTLY
ncbi:uncharacterized protein LOC119587362 [Penaeus monodon]|uniref:uncharacterized protein LOC119587362 n=1 Tax=Penaeus monodon TaxID=6687 RepID=UPI0018A76C91|nr:uncharacterized protein LOC119587362 [Penaeus monodon]